MFNRKENEETIEIEKVNGENKNDVHEDQQNMFEAEGAFSEAVVVEKEEVKVGAGDDEFGDTAVFNLAKDKPEGTDIDHEELSVGELQGTAKDYFNATHSESIEDKIGELRKLADETFDDNSAADEEEDSAINAVADIFSEENEAKRKKEEKKKKKAEKKKNKKKGVVSDDDIEMLAAAFSNDSEEQAAEEEPVDEADNAATGVFDNPFGDIQEEENEEEKLIKALGNEDKEYTSFESVFGNDIPCEEYTDKEQEKEISKALRSRAIFSMFSVILTLIAAVFCIYFEAAAGTDASHPEMFESGKYGVTYALSMLQIMFVGVIFNLDGVKRAFLGLRPSKASAEGFCALTITVCTLHTVCSCFIVNSGVELVSFCSVGCIALVFLSVNSFIKAYTALTSFCVVASKAPKTSSFVLGRDSLEAECFEKYLDEETNVMTVGKSSFVSGFFKNSFAAPSVGAGTFKVSLAVVIIAAIAAVLGGVFERNVYHGVCTFTVICLAALPVNALLSTALPFFVASMKAKKFQTAFVGEAACDAYENCGIISFDDTEVFPAKNVKVSSIRTYSNNRIDKVILYMARVFDKIEGRLSYVFANSVQNVEEQNVEAQIVEHFSNGISAKIDGKDILVGTEDFLRLYDIETTSDNIDESFLHSLGSIMYLSVDGALAAKFYIKYTMKRSFESVLHSFYDAGICVGIKTLDPCITTELVCKNLRGSNYPVAVIKNHSRSNEPSIAEETDGAVVSLSGIHNFLRGFIKLDNLRNIYRTNTIISVVSALLGAGISVFLSLAGSGSIGMLFIILFQLVWCVPTVLFSILSNK